MNTYFRNRKPTTDPASRDDFAKDHSSPRCGRFTADSTPTPGAPRPLLQGPPPVFSTPIALSSNPLNFSQTLQPPAFSVSFDASGPSHDSPATPVTSTTDDSDQPAEHLRDLYYHLTPGATAALGDVSHRSPVLGRTLDPLTTHLDISDTHTPVVTQPRAVDQPQKLPALPDPVEQPVGDIAAQDQQAAQLPQGAQPAQNGPPAQVGPPPPALQPNNGGQHPALNNQRAPGKRRTMPFINLTPPTFSGATSENAEKFKKDFESYCAIEDVTGDKQRELFRMLLKGLAANWYSTLDKDTIKDQAKVIEKFEANYITAKNPWVKLQKLSARRLLATEPVEDYIKDVLALCPESDPTAKMNHLMQGLDPADRATLMCQTPRDLDDFCHKLILLRASHAVRNQSTVNSIDNTVNSMENSTQVAAINNTLARIEERLQRPILSDSTFPERRARSQSPPSFRPRRQPLPSRSPTRFYQPSRTTPFTGRCFRCNRTGHMASDCRSRPQYQERYPNNNNFNRSRFPVNRGRSLPNLNRSPFNPRNNSQNRRLNN